MDEATLHHYQRRLLELLSAGEPPEAIIAALRQDPKLAEVRDYVDGLDPHALVVATELVARWSVEGKPQL